MSYKIPIRFSLEQVIEFANITGDDGPIHTKRGIVQGGFIISCLPKWIKQAKIMYPDMELIKNGHAVSMSMTDVKFRKTFPVNVDGYVIFELLKQGETINKMSWTLTDLEQEYCGGTWILHRAPDMSKIV